MHRVTTVLYNLILAKTKQFQINYCNSYKTEILYLCFLSSILKKLVSRQSYALKQKIIIKIVFKMTTNSKSLHFKDYFTKNYFWNEKKHFFANLKVTNWFVCWKEFVLPGKNSYFQNTNSYSHVRICTSLLPRPFYCIFVLFQYKFVILGMNLYLQCIKGGAELHKLMRVLDSLVEVQFE